MTGFHAPKAIPFLTWLAALAASLAVGCSSGSAPSSTDDTASHQTRTAETSEALLVDTVKTTSINVTEDAAVRAYLPNYVHGADVRLQVGRNAVNWDASMIKVANNAITTALGGKTLVSAKLALNVELATPIWTDSGILEAFPMNRTWKETNSTWNCANDTVPGDQIFMQCANADRWTIAPPAILFPMPFSPPSSAKVDVRNKSYVELDVTADVQRWLTNPAQNNGWMIRLQNDPVLDWVNFYSRESAKPPKLVLSYKDSCDFDTGNCGSIVKWEGPGQTSLTELVDPLDGPTTFQMAETFNWATTTPINETTPDGFPAIRYAMIYVETQDEKAALDAYQLEWRTTPLFRSERAIWAGKKGVLNHQGDGRGTFVYAMIPAKVYNAMRTAAFNDQAPYRAVILKPFPSEVGTNWDGSIRYDVLRAEGFLWRGQALGDPPEACCKLFKKVVNFVVDVAKGAIDGVRQGIGAASEFFRGDSGLQLTLYPYNTDSRFKTEDVIRQGWGKNRGKAIPISGVSVRAHQGALGVKLHKGRSDSNGFAKLTVASNQPTDMCVELENGYAKVVADLFPLEVCDFSGGSISRDDLYGGTVTKTITVRNDNVNSFIQATDGGKFMDTVAKKSMGQATILTGLIAKIVTKVSHDRSFTPCLGFTNFAFDPLYATINLAVEAAAVQNTEIGHQLTFLLLGLPGVGVPHGGLGALFGSDTSHPDIIMAPGNQADRLVTTHEYGHYVMCKLMNDEGRWDFSVGYTGVIKDRLINDNDADAEAGYIAEAWADFIASQVAAGTNYVNPDGANADNGSSRFCDVNSATCLDDNFGGSHYSYSDPNRDPFGQRASDPDFFHMEIARVLTLTHDVFDGRSDIKTADNPDNGATWLKPFPTDGAQLLTTAPSTFSLYSHQNDEAVALDGAALGDIIHRWAKQDGSTLTKKTYYRALSALMQANNVPDSEICKVFSLHSEDRTCPSYLPIAANVTPAPVRFTEHWPYGLSHINTPDERNGHWRWLADAPFATGFEYKLRNVTTNTQVESGTLPYAADPFPGHFDKPNLPYDNEFELAVNVANGSVKSSVVKASLVTGAEAVYDARIDSLTPGRSKICFTETTATSYEMVVGSEAHTVHFIDKPGTNERCHTFVGLEGLASYTVTVYALNRVGAPTTPHNATSFVPLAIPDVYVSDSRGNDTQTGAGAKATPYKTLDAALAFVRARRAAGNTHDGVQINMESGSYTMSAKWEDDGERFYTELKGDRDPTWTQYVPNSASVIIANTGTTTARSCSGETAVAAFVARNGAGLHLDHVAVPVNLVPSTTAYCTSAVLADNSSLTVKFSMLATVTVDDTASCSMPLSAMGTTPDADESPILEIDHSNLYNVPATAGVTAALPPNLFGLCTSSVGEVNITSTNIAATADWNPTPPAQEGMHVGAEVLNANSVQLGKNHIGVAPNAANYRANEKVVIQAGLLTSAQRLFAWSNVVTTTSGGGINATFSVSSTGTVDLLHNTILAGTDYAYDAAGPTEGARVLAIGGTPNAMRLVNNVLNYAAGNVTEVALLDRSTMSADPHDVVVAGNLYGLPESMAGGKKTPVKCSDSSVEPSWPNYDITYQCFRDSISDYDVRDNYWIDGTSCAHAADPVACLDGETGQFSWQLSSTSLAFDTQGKPAPFADGRVACTGADVSEIPILDGWNDRDIDGMSRIALYENSSDDTDEDCDGFEASHAHRHAKDPTNPAYIDQDDSQYPLGAGAYRLKCTCDQRAVYLY